VTTLLAHGDPDRLPEFGVHALLTQWQPEIVPLLGVATLLIGYLLPARALRRRGDAWSPWRSAAFVTGVGTVAVATLSPLGTYDTSLLSVHMVQHMLLAMVAPVFLALGAPVTLWLRTLPPGPRGWLLAAVHSRVARVLAFAPLAFAVYVVSPWALYFTGWYEATLESPFLHDMTHLHLVLVGSVFFWPLVGVDPVPGRLPYTFRMLETFATLPFHAFLGVTIMDASTLIAGDWYLGLGRSVAEVTADQQLAGGLLWASGDLLGALFFGALFVQWVRASQREAVREDRRLDRLDAAESARAAAADRASGPADSIGS
jgi:cytochrome c oxidase assembly factor CtaG